MHFRMAAAIALALAAYSPRVSAQSPSPVQSSAASTASPEVARAITEVEARIEDALTRRDRSALEPLVATPFTWVHSSDGRVDSREVWLAAAAQGMALSGQRAARSEHGPALAVYGEPGAPVPHTAVRVARVQLRDSAASRESWFRQTRVFVRGVDGIWRLAWGQGTVMYEGPPLDAALHARYAGRYVIGPGRALALRWEDGALLARFPNGAETQVFLASPTEEAVRTIGAGRLRFTLGPDGRPVSVMLVRGEQEIWRATRRLEKQE